VEEAGFEAIHPRNTRMLFHGWNGAQFAWRSGPIGTFATLTDKQKATLSECVDRAIDAINDTLRK